MPVSLSPFKPKVFLLGNFEVRWNDEALDTFSYVKMRALLAYLAMEPREHSREILAELFWPDNDLATARGNLRRTLADLRRALPNQWGEWFAATKNSIRLTPIADIDAKLLVDFCRTKSSEITGNGLDANCYIEMYRGEFLQGLSLPDCMEFENWLLIQRETLHRCVLALLEQERSRCEKSGDTASALFFALRITVHEPWNENGHYHAMQLHALNRQYGAALALYESYSQMLKKELGALPGDAIRKLAGSIHANIHNQAVHLPDVDTGIKSEPTDITRIALKAERRQVTVLYCELSSPTLDDPEDAIEWLRPVQKACMDIIRRKGGHVMQSHGGGLLAYFGYPQAHEHAARYAIQVALNFPHSDRVDIRTAVHTGLILTDENSLTPDTFGRTSKIAIQLRHYATSRDVVISQATHRLTEGYFDYFSGGIKDIPGFYPVFKIPVFYVTAESGARTRFETVVSLTPLAGRKNEIDCLVQLCDNTNANQGSSHLIQAEAGLGKSRLLYVLKARLMGSRFHIHELRCFPEFNQSPFHPIVSLLEGLLGFDQRQTGEQRFNLLDQYLKQRLKGLSPEVLPVVAHLLSLQEGVTWATGFSPQKVKEKTVAVLLEILQSFAAHQPVLLIVEDLHWIDPSTLELLHSFLIQQQESVTRSTLVLLTARPEFIAPWSHEICSPFALTPLADDDARTMVESLSVDIPVDIIKRIVERADGIPLFVEELVKVAISDHFVGVPDSLQDLLMARIDSLGKSRYAIQLAACVGREFTLDLLKRVLPDGIDELHKDLDELFEAGLIHTRDDHTWQFKHALVRDAAYALQSKPDRQRAHRLIANVLLDAFAEISEFQPELLAQHFSAGGEIAKAILFWIKAGQRATRSSAINEATEHFKSALLLLEEIPEGLERNCHEFAILTSYSPVLYAAYGYGSEEARQANSRIAELTTQVGDSPELFFGKWSFVMNTIASGSAPNGGALVAAQQLLSLSNNDPIHLQAAHHAVANAAFWCGQFEISYKHAELAIALFNPVHRQLFLQQCGTDLSIFSMSYLACSLFFLGDVARAETLCEEKLILARTTGHPHTVAQALSFAATLYRWIGKPQRVLELSVETINLSSEHDFSLWLACGEMTHGWSLVRLGQPELGFAKLHASVQGMRASLCGIPTVFISALAESYLYAEQYTEALALFDEALSAVTRVGDGGLYEAEIHRLRGECLLVLSGPNEGVLVCFDNALAISKKQNALTLGSRALTSKSQLQSLLSASND